MPSDRFEALNSLGKRVRSRIVCDAMKIVMPPAQHDVEYPVVSERGKFAPLHDFPRKAAKRTGYPKAQAVQPPRMHIPTDRGDKHVYRIHGDAVRKGWGRHLMPPDTKRGMDHHALNDVREFQDIGKPSLHADALINPLPLLRF